MESPTGEEEFKPFGPMSESIDASGLFTPFGSVSGEDTGESVVAVEQGPTQELGFRKHIIRESAAVTCAVVVVAMLHSLQLSFVNSRYGTVVTNTDGQTEQFGEITNAGDGSALTTGPTAGPRTGWSNDPVNVLMNSCASEYYFDDATIPGLRDRLVNSTILDVPRERSTAGMGELIGIGK